MARCTECGTWLTAEYKRVLSDDAGDVQCPPCRRTVH